MHPLLFSCLMGICGSPEAPPSGVATASGDGRLSESAPTPVPQEGGQAERPVVALAPPSAPASEPPPAGGKAGSKTTRAEIAHVVQRNIGAVRRCYEKGLAKDGALSGVIQVGWKIQVDGHVSSVNIVETAKRNDAIEDCLHAEILRWEFPPSSEPVVVGAYPFVLDAKLLARHTDQRRATAGTP